MAFDLKHAPIADGSVLVSSARSAGTRVLSTTQSQVLLACAVPRELGEHVQEIIRQMPISVIQQLRPPHDPAVSSPHEQSHEALVAELLSLLVADGLLRPEAELMDILLHGGASGAEDQPPAIGTICIPTRNRPAVLRRALESYMHADVRVGRQTEFVLSDDSDDPEIRRENLASARAAAQRFGKQTRIISPERRKSYARELAEHAGLPPEVCAFALVGDGECEARFGATRNTLLLDTLGELVVQVDDDTVCQLFRPPTVRQEARISSRPDVHEYWYYPDLAQAVSAGAEFDGDLLGLHERVLGKRPAEVLAGSGATPVFDAVVTSRAVTNAEHPESRIIVSYGGLLGDCGGKGIPQYKLLLRDESFERLVRDAEEFDSVYFSRQLIRCAPALTLTEGGFCITANMGFDNRVLLPPYPPVHTGEDTFFGVLRTVMQPYSYDAFLPFCTLHDPTSFRPNCQGHVPLEFTANDVIRHLSAAFLQVWPAAGGNSTLRAIGSFFQEVAALPAPAFADYARTAVVALFAPHSRALEDLRNTRAKAPAFWHARMAEYQREVTALVAGADPASPVDFPGDAGSRQRRFQVLLARYGDLLAAWPDIVEAAYSLRAAGVRVSEPV
ncbi:MAG TPA: glycosyltransferase family A protein [Longimicrobium sp.]|jgi:hypothetical protein